MLQRSLPTGCSRGPVLTVSLRGAGLHTSVLSTCVARSSASAGANINHAYFNVSAIQKLCMVSSLTTGKEVTSITPA